MKKLNAVIVEDVTTNPVLLQNLLKTYCQDVTIAAVAENVKEAVKIIGEVAPQVVFCDIDLPDGNGFEILEHFKPLPFKVIIFSGNQEYAYKAIKFHPVDFILKPIRINELVYAVNAVTGSGMNEKVSSRTDTDSQKESFPEKFTLMDSASHVVIEICEIIMLNANGNNTDFYLLKNRKMTFYRCLEDFIDLLDNHPEFIRTHRLYLVNLEQVKSCSRAGLIKLSENHTAQLGRSFRKEFYNCFRRSCLTAFGSHRMADE